MGGNPSAQVPSPNRLFVDPGGGATLHRYESPASSALAMARM